MMLKRSRSINIVVKYFLPLQKAFVHSEAQLQKEQPRIAMSWVFPNPVPPGYNGTIAIRGLVNNAIVKITEMDGRLVYQTRALGGQAVWDGKDYKGRIISSGVYLILISDDGRQEKAAGKIVFVK
jgi:hypothetical protein